ncbi:hypothetical protein BC828DRAFT_406909 [Blastocladiella britannica]|nr:hypothetical protein BC828DRAFT_406909 [Blastocladiella britannica]
MPVSVFVHSGSSVMPDPCASVHTHLRAFDRSLRGLPTVGGARFAAHDACTPAAHLATPPLTASTSSRRYWLIAAALAVAATATIAVASTEDGRKHARTFGSTVGRTAATVRRAITSGLAGTAAGDDETARKVADASIASVPSLAALRAELTGPLFDGELTEENLDFILKAFNLSETVKDDDIGKGNQLCGELPLSDTAVARLIELLKSQDATERRYALTLISGLVEADGNASKFGEALLDALLATPEIKGADGLDVAALIVAADVVASMILQYPKTIEYILPKKTQLKDLVDLLSIVGSLSESSRMRITNLWGLFVRRASSVTALLDADLHRTLLALARDSGQSARSRYAAGSLLCDMVAAATWDEEARILRDFTPRSLEFAIYNWLVEDSDTVGERLTFFSSETVKAPVSPAFTFLALVFSHDAKVAVRFFEDLEDKFVDLFVNKISGITGTSAVRALSMIAAHPGRVGEAFSKSPALAKFLETRWSNAISMDVMWGTLALPRNTELLEILNNSYLIKFAYNELPTSTKSWGFLHSIEQDRTKIPAALLASLPDIVEADDSDRDTALLRVMYYHLVVYATAEHASALLDGGLATIIKRRSLDPKMRGNNLMSRTVGLLALAIPDRIDELVMLHHVPMMIQVHSVLSEVAVMAKTYVDTYRIEHELKTDLLGVIMDRLAKLDAVWGSTAMQMVPALVTALWKHARETIEGVFELTTRVLELFCVDSQNAVYAMVRLGDSLERYAAETGRQMRGGAGPSGINEFQRDLDLGQKSGEFVRKLLLDPFRIAAHFAQFDETKHLAIKQLRLLAVNASRFSVDQLSHDTLMVMAQAPWELSQEMYELANMKQPRVMCNGLNTGHELTLALQEMVWRSAFDRPRIDPIHWGKVTGNVYTGVRGNMFFNGAHVTNSALGSHGVSRSGKYGFILRTNDTSPTYFGWATATVRFESGVELGSTKGAYMYNPVPCLGVHDGAMTLVDIQAPAEGAMYTVLDLDNGTISVGVVGRGPALVVFRGIDTTETWFPAMTLGSFHAAAADFMSTAGLPAGYLSFNDARLAGRPLTHLASGRVEATPSAALVTYVSPSASEETVRGAPVFPTLYYELDFVPSADGLSAFGYQQGGVNFLFVMGAGVEFSIHFASANPVESNVWKNLVPALARKLRAGVDIKMPAVLNFVDREGQIGEYDVEFKERTGEGQFVLYRFARTLDESVVAGARIATLEAILPAAAATLPSVPSTPTVSPRSNVIVEVVETVETVEEVYEDDDGAAIEATTLSHTVSDSIVDVTGDSDSEDDSDAIEAARGLTGEAAQPTAAATPAISPAAEAAEPIAADTKDTKDDEAVDVADLPLRTASVPLPQAATRPIRVGFGVGPGDDGDPVVFVAKHGLVRKPDRLSLIKFSDDHIIRPIVIGADQATLYLGIGRDFTLPLVTGTFMFSKAAEYWGINLESLEAGL